MRYECTECGHNYGETPPKEIRVQLHLTVSHSGAEPITENQEG